MLEKIVDNPQLVSVVVVMSAIIWAFFFGHVIPRIIYKERIQELKDDATAARKELTELKAERAEERRDMLQEIERLQQTIQRLLGVLEPVVGTGVGKQGR